MAARRGRSQARRNGGSNGGLPGWAWMIIGIVLTIAVVMLAPRLLKSDGTDGFYRPRANPDAQPALPSSVDDDTATPAPARRRPAAAPAETAPLPATEPDYDFYTVLPGQEVPMTDAELAASARAEEARRQREDARRREDAAELARPQTPAAAPSPASTAATTTPSTAAPAAAPAAAAAEDTTARYLLQAGSFSASGDAEALKARIALLGLSARVESGTANGRTVYRVRMGPYGTATELADAKAKLQNGGLQALPIKVQ